MTQVIACRREVFRSYKSNIDTVQRLGMADELQHMGFRHFKMRDVGRFDLEVSAARGPLLHGSSARLGSAVELPRGSSLHGRLARSGRCLVARELGSGLVKRTRRQRCPPSPSRFHRPVHLRLQVEAFKTPAFDFLHGTETPWYPLVEFLLGGDCQLAHCGKLGLACASLDVHHAPAPAVS